MIKDVNKIYTFLDFKINPQQRTITQNSHAINLSKKSFDMLVVLLQRHGELITKDELLSAVWPNQFITDSALNKQVARLRHTFDVPKSTESIIETARGVGIRFLANVDVVDDTKATPNKHASYWKTIIATVALITVGLLLYNYLNLPKPDKPNNVKLEDIEPLKTTKKSINIAIVPAQKTDEWLAIGGLNYLSELLQNHDEIDTISPQTKWFNQNENNVLALQLSQVENIDYALIINTIKQKNHFVTNITLRNKHGVLATGELQAISLSNLFEKLDSWTILQLNITSGVVFTDDTHQSQLSDFALESYLRGLASARKRNLTQAEQFLQTTVNQNRLFFPAWLLLAEVEAELGNFQKSLATIETIEKLENFDDYYLNDLYNVKARTLIYLNNLDDAQTYLTKSLRISQQEGDMKAQIVSLSSQAMIQDRTGINKETLTITLKQLELVKKYNPLPNQIAELNHNLAIINQYLFKYDEAKKYVALAIKQYHTLQNYSGLVSSYRVMGNIHNDLAETGQALLVLEKAEKWLDKVDSPIILAHYYSCKARNLYEQGYLKKSKREIDKLQAISISYDNIEAKIMALIIQFELEISYKEFDSARYTIKQLLGIVMVNPAQHPSHAEYIASIDMYLSALTDSAIISRKKMNDYLKLYPSLKQSIGAALIRVEAHIFAAEGYRNKAISMLQEQMEYRIKDSHFLDASYIGYEILELQWQNDMVGYLKIVNRIQELTTFDYPILKYRAKYLAYKKDYINAVILMQELKPKARGFWTIDDQLLLEQYQKKLL